MLLSVPLTVTIKILLERSTTWGWVAILLDAGENAHGAAQGDPSRPGSAAGDNPPALDPLSPGA